MFLVATETRAQGPQQPAPPATASRVNMRECGANPVLPNRKKPAKSKHPLPAEPPPACREVAGDAIELQEFLQAQGRKQGWRMSDSRASEDSWSYVRYFGSDDLDKYADTTTLASAVKFTNGKAAVIVRTTDVGGGFVRVQIAAHFQGEGTTADAVLGQPATLWELASKGVLEKELFAAVEQDYHPLR